MRTAAICFYTLRWTAKQQHRVTPVSEILGAPVSKPSRLTTSATDDLPRRLPEQGFPMRLPVRLETTVRTENRTAAAVPDALYALKGTTLLSTATAI